MCKRKISFMHLECISYSKSCTLMVVVYSLAWRPRSRPRPATPIPRPRPVHAKTKTKTKTRCSKTKTKFQRSWPLKLDLNQFRDQVQVSRPTNSESRYIDKIDIQQSLLNAIFIMQFFHLHREIWYSLKQIRNYFLQTKYILIVETFINPIAYSLCYYN